LNRIAVYILLVLLPAVAAAQTSPLIVQNAWMRAAPGSDTAAVYLVLKNTGAEPIIVIGASSPIAGHAMIHETSTTNGISRMRMHDRLVIAPGQSVSFSPGGLHVMLSGLKKAPVVGQMVPLVLLLAKGGTVQTAVVVRPLDAQ
jgi:copper(I)-binding protein